MRVAEVVLALLVLVWVQLSPFGPLAAEAAPSDIATFVPHPPVHIIGDRELANSSAVIQGQGTEEDPFVIAGWAIQGLGGSAVWIENTSSHVIIERTWLIGSFFDSSYSAGVRLERADNVTVRGNLIEWSQFGIHARESRALDLLNNELNGLQLPAASASFTISNGGIHVLGTSDVLIHQNRIDQFGWGIAVDGASENATVSQNLVTRTSWGSAISVHGGAQGVNVYENKIHKGRTGVLVSGADHVKVSNNELSDLVLGLDIFQWRFNGRFYPMANVSFDNNTITKADRLGFVDECDRCTIRHNLFRLGLDGLSISSAALVERNRFENNAMAIGSGTSSDAVIRENSIDGSNAVLATAFLTPLDLRHNWWGSAAGPDETKFREVGGGTVVYDPWLTVAPEDAGPVTV